MEVWHDIARQDAGGSLTRVDLIQKGLFLKSFKNIFFMAGEVKRVSMKQLASISGV